MVRMELIRAENIGFSYNRVPVLKNISLAVKQGEIVSLLGPNGSGKTTLLKLLLGIYRPKKGTVLFMGKPISDIPPRELARNIAYVPQFHKTAFEYRVMDIVLMGRSPHKAFFSPYSPKDMDIALWALEKLSILHLQNRKYTEISGGERQLALVARALTQGSSVLVMDEPSASLDYGNQVMLLEQIRTLADEGYTVIKSTHFPDHALWIAHRVIMLQNGDIVANGKPAEVMNDESVCSLYNARISIVDVARGLKICVPQSSIRKGQIIHDRT